MKLSSKAKFLRFVRILVDETTKEAPLSRKQIIQKCKEDGFEVTPQVFDDHIEDMRQAGVIIKRRYDRNEYGLYNLYWYDEGWI